MKFENGEISMLQNLKMRSPTRSKKKNNVLLVVNSFNHLYSGEETCKTHVK